IGNVFAAWPTNFCADVQQNRNQPRPPTLISDTECPRFQPVLTLATQLLIKKMLKTSHLLLTPVAGSAKFLADKRRQSAWGNWRTYGHVETIDSGIEPARATNHGRGLSAWRDLGRRDSGGNTRSAGLFGRASTADASDQEGTSAAP